MLAEQLAAGEPLDQIARRLLLADEEGSELFYVQFRNQPEEATVAVSRIFLGLQLQCARCHYHPYESWTQRDFYGMAAFFAHLVMIDAGGGMNNKKFMISERRTGEVLFTGPAIDQKPGQKGEPVYAKFLGGQALVEPPLPLPATPQASIPAVIPAAPATQQPSAPPAAPPRTAAVAKAANASAFSCSG